MSKKVALLFQFVSISFGGYVTMLVIVSFHLEKLQKVSQLLLVVSINWILRDQGFGGEGDGGRAENHGT